MALGPMGGVACVGLAIRLQDKSQGVRLGCRKAEVQTTGLGTGSDI